MRVAIAVPLEAELVDRIRAAGMQLEVNYEPDLLPPARYPGDHRGAEDFRRPEEAERRWQEMLESAEILFGLPGGDARRLAALIERNPSLRWVQAMAAGAGQQVQAAGIGSDVLERVIITTASGVHAGPLAEFSLMGLLAFTKDLPRIQRDQRARRWTEYPHRELHGQTLVVLGLGRIGEEVARLAGAFGMRVVGVNRRGVTQSQHVERMVAVDRLSEALSEADAVVISLPLTDQTRGLLDERALRSLKRGGILVNVGRGALIDEAALIECLRDGHLTGAALDVTTQEPPPPDSPLWELSNVLLSSHTAALSFRENERIVELFLENCRRLVAGEELLNRIDPQHFY
jgi:phosphoglycerate dehydrogenase-like enzyme